MSSLAIGARKLRGIEGSNQPQERNIYEQALSSKDKGDTQDNVKKAMMVNLHNNRKRAL